MAVRGLWFPASWYLLERANSSATSMPSPGRQEPTSILRLHCQRSAKHWNIGIYLASDERYTESEFPAPAPQKKASATPSSSTPALAPVLTTLSPPHVH
jgi:hypothetical protein